jgi:V/A-type H+-transporting ATPase subunit K
LSEIAELSVQQGGIVFAAGLALGLVGLISGMKQGEVSAQGIEGIGRGYDVFGKTMVLAVFPELYAIVAFAATFIFSGAL